jgi:hypothetical protein
MVTRTRSLARRGDAGSRRGGATPGVSTRAGSARRANRESRAKAISQREVLRDVMLSAGSCNTWLTLRELSRITRYGEASISAQLRHLRKRKHGGFVIEKRARVAGAAGRWPHQPKWEYRLGGSRTVEDILCWRTPALLRNAINAARILDVHQIEAT